MTLINCEIEILTPMFLGGAPQTLADSERGKPACELRAQSIKGLMRFWWRAYKYGQLVECPDAESRLSELRKVENKIFGSVSGNGNKSSFAISVSPKTLSTSAQSLPGHKVEVDTKGKTVFVNILEYLCYGTYVYVKGQGNKFIREYIKENQVFPMKLRIDDENCKEDVLTALYFFSEFGGIGSRSRNGFGSLNIRNKTEVFSPLGKDFMKALVSNTELLKRFKILREIPPFTAFSHRIRLFRTVQPYKSWDLCLADLGKIYKKSREALEPRHHYDKRQYIGAPLDPPKDTSFKSLLDRHSKPYFIKVAKSEGGYSGCILFLPSLYLYNSDTDRTGKQLSRETTNIQFQNACDEFNRLLSADHRLEAVL
ncbi:MAG: type III-B CRISPR module RAMP protein Cmr1 [Clostridiaceae bacterium]|nr:type III-B CRISPR module RAMP protein Cmr1 [Clostridiaceae bacterium]